MPASLSKATAAACYPLFIYQMVYLSSIHVSSLQHTAPSSFGKHCASAAEAPLLQTANAEVKQPASPHVCVPGAQTGIPTIAFVGWIASKRETSPPTMNTAQFGLIFLSTDLLGGW